MLERSFDLFIRANLGIVLSAACYVELHFGNPASGTRAIRRLSFVIPLNRGAPCGLLGKREGGVAASVCKAFAKMGSD